MKTFYMSLMGVALLAGCAPFEHGHYIDDVSYENAAGDPAGTPILFNGGYGSGSAIAEYRAALGEPHHSTPAVYSEPVGCGLDCGPSYVNSTPVVAHHSAPYVESAPLIQTHSAPFINSAPLIQTTSHVQLHPQPVHRAAPLFDAGPIHVAEHRYESAPIASHLPLAKPIRHHVGEYVHSAPAPLIEHREPVQYVEHHQPVPIHRPASLIENREPPRYVEHYQPAPVHEPVQQYLHQDPVPVVTASTSSAPPIQVDGGTIHVRAPAVHMNAPAYGAPAFVGGYGAPAYGAPPYGAPAYGAPGYGLSQLPPPPNYGAYPAQRPGYPVAANYGAGNQGGNNCYSVCNPTVY